MSAEVWAHAVLRSLGYVVLDMGIGWEVCMPTGWERAADGRALCALATRACELDVATEEELQQAA
jgi:hypothetical protein